MSDCGEAHFNFCIWAARYPELVNAASNPVTEFMAAGDWQEAGLYLFNCGGSLVHPIGKRAIILGMITAHIAALRMRAANSGDPTGGIVGRISSATEGLVSVSTELDVPGSAAWWGQTSYGLAAWQALAPYRTAAYIAAPQIPLAQQSVPFGIGVFGGPVFFPGRRPF